MEAKEAIRRGLDDEPFARVKDRTGLVLFTCLRKGRPVYVIDSETEPPIQFFRAAEQTTGH